MLKRFLPFRTMRISVESMLLMNVKMCHLMNVGDQKFVNRKIMINRDPWPGTMMTRKITRF